MEKVKKLREAGAQIPSAIKEALQPQSVSQFADEFSLSRPLVSAVINGSARPTDQIIAALISKLGGSADEWKFLLWEAARPETAQAS
jgi:plasmid maintenance system antidote protein VapI